MGISEQLSVISDERVISKIYLIRGEKVMLDNDLAELYGVETRRLNEQVKRNIGRFPIDFMFRLTCLPIRKLEIANCDIKLGRPPETALCLLRAWLVNVVKCPQ